MLKFNWNSIFLILIMYTFIRYFYQIYKYGFFGYFKKRQENRKELSDKILNFF